MAEGSHAHRDLLRKLKKDKKWPSPFEAHVPVYNRKTCQTEMGRVEIMLPHELLQCMCKWNDHDEEFWKLDNLRHACKQHLQNAAMELGMEGDKVLPISLWLDGVPVKYDRSESLEVVTLLFPHLGGDMSSMRLPLTALYKSHMAKDVTLDAIMEILTWSLTSLAEGTYPKYGPHGEELKGKRQACRPKAFRRHCWWRSRETGLPLSLLFDFQVGQRWTVVVSDVMPTRQTSTSWMPAVLHRGEISPLAIGSCWCEYMASVAACLLCMELQGSNPLYLQSTGYIVVIRE